MGSGSSVFITKLRDDTAARPKRWLYLLYDQLNLELNPWEDEPPESDRKSTRLNSSHSQQSRMPSSA